MQPSAAVPAARTYLTDVIEKAPGPTDDIVGILRDTKTAVVANFPPAGSEEATKWYTEQILTAGCAMVNCMPVFVAREPYWQKRFEDRGVPVIGDDVKSQLGATIVHRVLTSSTPSAECASIERAAQRGRQ